MSGPLPKQQKSRSPKGEPTEDVISKADAVKIAKSVSYDDLKWDGIEPDCTTEQNGDGSEDEGEHDEYS